jgi:hypothetical protein
MFECWTQRLLACYDWYTTNEPFPEGSQHVKLATHEFAKWINMTGEGGHPPPCTSLHDTGFNSHKELYDAVKAAKSGKKLRIQRENGGFKGRSAGQHVVVPKVVPRRRIGEDGRPIAPDPGTFCNCKSILPIKYCGERLCANCMRRDPSFYPGI